jgi:hypothetical protein
MEFFLMKNHTMQSLTTHSVLLCIYLRKSLNGHDCPLPILELPTSTYMTESLWKAVPLLLAVSYNYIAP